MIRFPDNFVCELNDLETNELVAICDLKLVTMNNSLKKAVHER